MVAAAVSVLLASIVVGGGPRTPAVVAVRVAQPGGSAEIATGVVVAPGRVLTVAHVLPGGRGVSVDGAPATVLRERAGQDLALLAVPGATGPQARYATAGSDGLRVLLRDGARRAVLRRRIVATLADAPGKPRRAALELGVDVEPGDSGAPVVDGRGRVVGIVFARSTRRDGVAYAVRTDRAGALP